MKKERFLSLILLMTLVFTLRPAAATAEILTQEQFTLVPGGTYYFDLSAQSIPGTVTTSLPDSSLKWVPFTYAGTINAYSLGTDSIGDTGASVNATASRRSLFVAQYNVSRDLSWDTLNDSGLIFGKTYSAGGVSYKLRSPSVGSSMEGVIHATPETNEWDQIMNKDVNYINNPLYIFVWGQDTSSSEATYRAVRGHDERYWTCVLSSSSSYYLHWRSVLEILNTDQLGHDGLKTITYDMGTNGRLGASTEQNPLTTATVVYTGTLTLPEVTEANGFTYTGAGKGILGWYDINHNFYEAGTTPALATSTVLTAGYGTPNIITASLPDGAMGIAYSQTLATVGVTPITWSIESGSMPGGLTLADDTISGTPTAEGAFTFTLKAKNSLGEDTKALSINIRPAYTITALAESGGSIDPSGTTTVGEGSSQTYTITPNNGYTIASIVVDGVDQGGIRSYTFTGVTGNHNIKAVFILEQFALIPGGTYYFDLSAQGITGVLNTHYLPDTALKWVPFTYVGTVNAYSLGASSSGDTSASTNATVSPRSLFVSDQVVASFLTWDILNSGSHIFGKNYEAGRITYMLRSLSGGSDKRYSAAGFDHDYDYGYLGTPVTNEWDQIVAKGHYLENPEYYPTLCQDTTSGDGTYRAVRYYDSYSKQHEFSYIKCNQENSINNSFRPALEILNTDQLGYDGLKTAVYYMGTNGRLGSSTEQNPLTSATVVYTGALVLPEVTEVNGFHYTGTGTGTGRLGWYHGDTFYAPGTELSGLSSGETLIPGYETMAPRRIPAITTTSLPDGALNTAYGQTLSATCDIPITWSINSGILPAGLSLTGNAISGISTETGSFTITVMAESSEGSDAQSLNIVISDTPTTVRFGGYDWLLMGYNGGGVASSPGTMTLLAKSSMGKSQFNSDVFTMTYLNSALHTNTSNLLSNFDSREQAIMVGRRLNDVNTTMTDQKLWPLSKNEAGILPLTVQKFSDDWWLRTQVLTDADYVYSEGDIYTRLLSVIMAIRPACVLDTTAILFTSAAQGKLSGTPGSMALTLISATPGDELKLTLKDSSHSSFGVEQTSVSAIRGSTVTLNYSGAVPGANEYISAMLVDGSGMLYYGRMKAVSAGSESGTVDIHIPSNLTLGSYILKVFSEQYNGDNETDYAGTPEDIALTVSAEQPLFVGVTGITAVPSEAIAGVDLTLTGTVEPADATNKTIEWSVKDAGTTGATVTGSTLSTTAAGTVTVTATIDNGATETTDYTKDFSIVVNPGTPTVTTPTITTTSLPDGTVGTAYSQTLEATGNTPITWTMDTDSLPNGLTLSGDGIISGTPTAEGTFNFTVKAKNIGGEDTNALSIVINAAASTDKILVSIITPDAITGVANGTAKTAAALGLPSKVTLETDRGNVQADVSWDVASSSYDPDGTGEQTFAVSGSIALPGGVINPRNVTLSTSVNVTAASLPVTGGSVTVSGNAKYGETLTVVTSGITYTPDTSDDVPTYQWKRGGVNIAGATASSYTLVQADIGQTISVTVTADGVHATGSVTSTSTAAVEKTGGPAAPVAPTLTSKTHNSVTLEANTAYEFRIDGGTWQDSNVFTGLLPETEYTFTARVKETATHEASAASDDLSVTTDVTPVEPDTTAPTVADGTITASGLTYNGVTLNWNKATDNVSPQGELQYLVYYSDSDNIATVTDAVDNGTAVEGYATDISTKEIDGLDGNTTYYFNVIVMDEAGNKSAYTMKAITTEATPPATVLVTFITVSGTGNTTTVANGSALQMIADIVPSNATDKTVTWSVYSGTGTADINTSTGLLIGTGEGTVTVRATANDGSEKYGEANITVTAVSLINYTVTFDSLGGSSVASITGVTSGSAISVPATPRRSDYTFGGWYKEESCVNAWSFSTDTVTRNISLYAKWTYNGGGGGGGNSGGSSGSRIPATYNAVISGNGTAGTTLPVNVNTNTGSATIDLGYMRKDIFADTGTAMITVSSIPGVNSYTLGMPVASLSGSQGKSTMSFATDVASITISSNMLAGIPGAEGKKAGITISKGDKSGLPDVVKTAIGDRTIVQLTLTLNGTQTEWNNPDASVTLSIPYTPTAEELANPESIVIWYIDGSGNAISVPNGHYNPTTGAVTFTTIHFSYYAVGYNKVSFKDVAAGAWYAKAVSFIAARKITSGTGNSNFSPEAKLTRGEFIVLLLKAYGIDPDENPTNNFSDAGNTYYTGYLASAKRLGISAGVGNNMYAPDKEITRQEMFSLLYNALKIIGKLPEGDSGKTLSDFSDTGDIAFWAKNAMTLLVETGTIGGNDGRLTPTDTTTRAEMAQVLHNLLAK